MARKPHGLDAKPIPGRPPQLSDYHLHKLERLLRQGANKHGWPNQLWTADRVARLIRQRLGISFHPEHVRKILKQRLGWTSQKPKRKARERDDKEVERWRGDERLRILREAFHRRTPVVFVDESGFQLTPSVRCSLAPRGHTPVLDSLHTRVYRGNATVVIAFVTLAQFSIQLRQWRVCCAVQSTGDLLR